ncbi:MAG: hypothetical protein WCL39_04430 [Armatimonadota bacterium]
MSVVHRLRYCVGNALREAAKASIAVTLGVYGHVLPGMTRDAINILGDHVDKMLTFGDSVHEKGREDPAFS